MRRKRKSLTPETPLAVGPGPVGNPRPVCRPGADLTIRARRRGPALKESNYRARARWRADPPPGLPARRRETRRYDESSQRTGSKTVLTDAGALAIDGPRDREGRFAPRLIPKHERRFTGFDDKILALDARGMTVREIQGFLAEMYHVEVSPDLISTVTDGTSPR